MAAQDVGELALSIEFDKGEAASLTITISDTTPADEVIETVTATLASPGIDDAVASVPEATVEDTAHYTHTKTEWSGAAGADWVADDIPVAVITLTAKIGYTFTGLTADKITVAGGTVSYAEGQGVLVEGKTLSFTVTYDQLVAPDTTSWDGTTASSFAGGSGTAADPYQIATGPELAYLAQVINDTTTNATYRNKHYKLMANINLGGHGWTPIGLNATYCFGDSGGSFDGNGYAISNLQIGSASSPNTSYMNAGLFGWTAKGTLNNIALENVAVYSSYSNGNVGGLTGVSGMQANICNCYATGILQSTGNTAFVGGLTGKTLNGASIRNSFATADVSTDGKQCYLGGLVGQTLVNSTISNCYVTGDVAGGLSSKVGGLVGDNPGNIAITTGYWNSDAVQTINSAPQALEKGVGSGADATTSMSSEEMQAGTFVLTLSAEALKDSALKQWLLIAGRNDNYPLLGGVGAGLIAHENAEVPKITADPVGKTVSVNNEARLSVTAMINSGILSYRWYSNTYDSNTDGTLISGATDLTYKAPTGVVGTIYYYCVVTNTDSRATKVQTATTTSQTAAVTVIANEVPIATNVAVIGTVLVGQTLTGSYTYFDSDSDPEGVSLFKWYRADAANGAGEKAIPGATAVTYTSTESDLGKYICFEVTPVATSGATPGTAQKSPYTTQVLAAGLGYWTDPGNFSPTTPPLSGSTYTIRNAAELAWLAVNVNKGTNFDGKAFVLANDIDLSAHSWVPIGSSTNAFYATFDGNGKTISGLIIGTVGSGSQLQYTGLFGFANLATIKNVTLTGVNINSSSSSANTCAGALAARASNTSIINCQAAGNITTTGTPVKSGGLVGWLQISAVKDSQAAGSVTGGDGSYLGGLVGHMYKASLLDCYTTGSVTVGSSNCSAGGLTGFTEPSNNSITNCYAVGNVVAGSGAKSGGLIGWGQSQIINCYATGNVIGGMRVGGLIGCSNESAIINAYATGNLSGTTVGNLVGYGSATISDGYGKTNPVFPVNTEEMRSGTFVAILNSNVRSLNNSELKPWIGVSNMNDGYPLLNGVGDGANQSDAEVPIITNHPGDISAGQGSDASLSVLASGTGDLSYQWFQNNKDSNHHGSLIPGETGSTYTVPTSMLGTMYYYCAVINTKTTSGIHTVATEMSRAAAVVVTSAPVVPSSDAGLTSVAGQTDSNPGTQTGADAGNAIIWAVNVASEKATLARADIAVAADATFSLYSDAVFTTEVEDPATLALAVGDTVAYIKVTAEDGTTVKYYAVTIIRAAA